MERNYDINKVDLKNDTELNLSLNLFLEQVDSLKQKNSENGANLAKGDSAAQSDFEPSPKKAMTPSQVETPSFEKFSKGTASNAVKQDGLRKLERFFYKPEVEAHKDKDGNFDFTAIQRIAKEALDRNDNETLKIAAFVERNFNVLASMNTDNTLMPERTITHGDRKNLNIINDIVMNDSHPSERNDPRYSNKRVIAGAVIGAIIGTAVQAASHFIPHGEKVMIVGITGAFVPGVVGGAAGGFIGGASLGNFIEQREHSLLQYPLGIGGTVGGAFLSGHAAVRAWGPMLGAGIGAYIANNHGDRLWNLQNRTTFRTVLTEANAL